MSVATHDRLAPADEAWRAALVWLAGCPIALPAPDVAVGDDGSVGLEWQVETRHVAVCFGDDGAGELYLHDDASRFSASVDDLAGCLDTVDGILQILLGGTC